MTRASDRELGMGRAITRRDFLGGVGVALTGAAVSPSLAGEPSGGRPRQENYYPPALTGLRGSHPGSFEIAHALRDGASFARAENTGESYDMIVVGAGLSGLSAALFFQNAAGSAARTLVLDNHDDFGGHARRNEFTYGGRTLLLNGGTSNIEWPEHYSTVSSALLRDLGVDWRAAAEYDRRGHEFYSSLGLEPATFFARESFGADRLVKGNPLPEGQPAPDATRLAAWLAETPMAAAAQRDLIRLYAEGAAPGALAGLSDWEKKERLAKQSYRRFLEDADMHPHVLAYLDDWPKELFCVGLDAYPALYAWAYGHPGFQQLGLEPLPELGPLLHIGGGQHGREREWGDGPGIIDLPDGNATLARLLVRRMIPDALPGNSFEDSIMARLDYGRLDRASQRVRIRLNSTVVRVAHQGNPDSASSVEVTYVEGGRARSVVAEHVVLACWNPVISHICPELSDEQREALSYGEKVPVVYSSVALRDWQPFAELGVRSVTCPGMYHTGFSLGRASEIGGYRPPRSPQDPTVLHMTRAPCEPGKPKMEQYRAGRRDILTTSFETYEREIRDQLARGLAGTEFDPARDIVAITVNRWPHGFAYTYNTLDEPIEWALFPSEDRPCVLARRRFGRISIANSDAAATPHTDAAINEAHRAAREQLELRSRARREGGSMRNLSP